MMDGAMLGFLFLLVTGSYAYTWKAYRDVAKKEDLQRIERKINLICDKLIINGLNKRAEERREKK